MSDDDTEYAILRKEIHEVQETLNGILVIFNGIKDEIMPFIVKLENHPMAKMFLGGKK